MARQYGRIPKSGRRSATPEAPAEIRMVIAENYTLEQFALEVQRGFHLLQEYGATGLIRFRAQLMPLDAEGRPMTLYDEHGQRVTAIHIPGLPPEKPYRDNEPGVGVLPQPAPKHSGARPTPPAPGDQSPGAVPPRR